MMKKYLYIISVLSVIYACTDKFDEMNSNPNLPEDVPSSNILPGIIVNTAYVQTYISPNYYAQYVAQIGYVLEDLYRRPDNDINGLWEREFSSSNSGILGDCQYVIEKSKNLGHNNMEAAATIMSVFNWQVVTDSWGNVPFKQALSSKEGVLTPEYDSQESIYLSLIERLEEANTLLEANQGDDISSGDILYNGDIMKWKRFGNSLRLRLAIRMSNVNPSMAREQVEKVLGNPEQYPIITSNEDNALFKWTGDPYQHPFNRLVVNAQDGYAISKRMTDYLNTYNDPRLEVYAEPVVSDLGLEYIGAPNGPDEDNLVTELNSVSRLGDYYVGDPSGTTKLLTSSEVFFIIAESAENGWDTGSLDAEEAYINGILESCDFNGVNGTSILTSPEVEYSGTKDEKLFKIGMQKWVSLFMQGLEGWSETRRTDIPKIEAVPGSLFPDHNRGPFRLDYPATEESMNYDNWSSENAKIIDDLWGDTMWWDTRANVY